MPSAGSTSSALPTSLNLTSPELRTGESAPVAWALTDETAAFSHVSVESFPATPSQSTPAESAVLPDTSTT